MVSGAIKLGEMRPSPLPGVVEAASRCRPGDGLTCSLRERCGCAQEVCGYWGWRAEWDTGIAAIDHQHQEILRSCNRLRGALEEGKRELAGALLARLLEALREHFRLEEGLMALVEYPMLDDHRHGHEKVSARLGHYLERYRRGEEVGREILRELRLTSPINRSGRPGVERVAQAPLRRELVPAGAAAVVRLRVGPRSSFRPGEPGVQKRSFWTLHKSAPEDLRASPAGARRRDAPSKSYALRFCTPAARLAGTMIKADGCGPMPLS